MKFTTYLSAVKRCVKSSVDTFKQVYQSEKVSRCKEYISTHTAKSSKNKKTK